MAEVLESPERTQALAHLKFARVGPRKLRRVADAIRGKSVREALVLLQFSGVFASEPIEKLLRSAVANAENNHNMETANLFITKITVDGGPGGSYTRRLDPRAQGRAAFKRKRMSHVTIAVGTTPPTNQPKRRSGASIQLSTLETRRRNVAAPAAAPKRTRAKAAKAEAPTPVEPVPVVEPATIETAPVADEASE
jgi:large subunit ribosomal protein L22